MGDRPVADQNLHITACAGNKKIGGNKSVFQIKPAAGDTLFFIVRRIIRSFDEEYDFFIRELFQDILQKTAPGSLAPDFGRDREIVNHDHIMIWYQDGKSKELTVFNGGHYGRFLASDRMAEHKVRLSFPFGKSFEIDFFDFLPLMFFGYCKSHEISS